MLTHEKVAAIITLIEQRGKASGKLNDVQVALLDKLKEEVFKMAAEEKPMNVQPPTTVVTQTPPNGMTTPQPKPEPPSGCPMSKPIGTQVTGPTTQPPKGNEETTLPSGGNFVENPLTRDEFVHEFNEFPFPIVLPQAELNKLPQNLKDYPNIATDNKKPNQVQDDPQPVFRVQVPDDPQPAFPTLVPGTSFPTIVPKETKLT